VHPVQVSQWKKEAVERLPEVFARKADHDAESAYAPAPEALRSRLEHLAG